MLVDALFDAYLMIFFYACIGQPTVPWPSTPTPLYSSPGLSGHHSSVDRSMGWGMEKADKLPKCELTSSRVSKSGGLTKMGECFPSVF